MVGGGRAASAAAGGFLKKMVGNLFRSASRTGGRQASRAASRTLSRHARTLARRIGPRGSRTSSKTVRNKLGFGCADPVDPVSGDVIHHETDVELLGALPLVLDRTHLSSYRSGHWFGPSWASTLDQRLELDEAGMRFVTADGMRLFYRLPGAASGATPDATGTELAQAPDGGSAPGTVEDEVFPDDGPRWPLRGNREDGYEVVDHQSGRSFVFSGPAVPGRDESAPEAIPLCAILDRAGHRIDIVRAASGAPVEVRHSGGYRVAVQSTAGRVSALRLLTGTPDEPDVVLRRFRYDDAGNLAAVVNGSGRSMRFTYDEDGRMTGWIDRNQVEYAYHYDEQGRCVRTDGTGGFLRATFAYDDRANTTTYTNSLGATTTFVTNGRDQVVRRLDARGGTTRYAWDPNDHLTAETDSLGRTTRYRFDAYGNPTVVTRPDGHRTRVEYVDGLPVTVVDPDGAVWRQEYDAVGNLTALTDPTGAATRYAYDRHGHLESVTDALGRTSMVECDRAGLPVRITDPLGATTGYRRDGFGRIIAVTDPGGGTSLVQWTVDGRIARLTRPDGTTERWRYDGEGNEIEHVDQLGQVTRTEYAPFDVPAARVDPTGSRTTFGYDTELRLTSVTNPAGLTWRYSYDTVGNLSSETDFSGRTTRYGHDLAGQLVSRTNGAGRTIAFVRDQLGRVSERRADDGVATFEYDAGGRLIRAVNEDGDLVLVRDPLGRVLSETFDGKTVASRYDRAGRLVERTTPSGAHSRWEYDAADRAIALTSAGVAVSFGYDQNGRQVHRQAGRARVAQSWDPNGRLTEQVLTATGAASLAGGPVGSEPVAAGSLPGGPAAGTGTVGGSMAESVVVGRRGYGYRADDTITRVTDRASGSRNFDLDSLGRVVGVTGSDPEGAEHREEYTYEPGGGLTHASWPISSGLGGQSLDERGPRTRNGARVRTAGKTHFEYDQQGRVVVRRSRTLSGQRRVWRYGWDSDDRLRWVVTPDGSTWRYHYDAVGRRRSKQRHASAGELAERIDFHWDGVLPIEQTDLSGRTLTWDYEPDSWTPVAQTETAASGGAASASVASVDPGTTVPSGGAEHTGRARHIGGTSGWTPNRAARAPQEWIDRQFYLIVTDVAGAPAELVDVEGELAWRQPASLWGVPLGAGVGRTDCPLRFPGQYHDPETGQHYNYHRYYDPATGDYTSDDPFGLDGGPHPSRYVSNPLTWMDPLGLAACSKLREMRRLYGVMRAWVNNRMLNRSLRGGRPRSNATIQDLRDLTPGNPQRDHKLPNANARSDDDLLNSVFHPNDGQYIATHPVHPNVILQGNHRAYQLLQRAADPNNTNIQWDTRIFINRGVR